MQMPLKHTSGPNSSHSSTSSHIWFCVLYLMPVGQMHYKSNNVNYHFSHTSNNIYMRITWKLPGVFRHWPPLHKEPSSSHSLISLHIFPVASTSYPLSQIHRYVPMRFSHPPLIQMLGFCAHSLISIKIFCIKRFDGIVKTSSFQVLQCCCFRNASFLFMCGSFSTMGFISFVGFARRYYVHTQKGINIV